MSKKIIFRPVSKEVESLVGKPKPAKKYFPDWYKDIPKFENGELQIFMNGKANATMKSCMPFFDTFTTGYIQETWCDIYIDYEGDDIYWRFSLQPQIMDQRESVHKYPTIDGFSSSEFSWKQPWIPELPAGYSMIYTHPFNRNDLPFLSLTGIIDNDKYYMETSASHPFFIKKGFRGIIPAGTPMFQMIPIKRDSWESSFKGYDKELSDRFTNVKRHFYDGYKKLYWQKKQYN